MRVFYVSSLLPLVLALPKPQTPVYPLKYPFQNFTIDDVGVDCNKVAYDELYTCAMSFNFYDPNSEAAQKINGATCKQTWRWDGITVERGPKNNYHPGFVVCSREERGAPTNIFQFWIQRFTSPANFLLQITHLYKDDVFFREPYNYPNAFVLLDIPLDHVLEHVDGDPMHTTSTGIIEHGINGLTT